MTLRGRAPTPTRTLQSGTRVDPQEKSSSKVATEIPETCDVDCLIFARSQSLDVRLCIHALQRVAVIQKEWMRQANPSHELDATSVRRCALQENGERLDG